MDSLEGLRRTHYSTDITPSAEGAEAVVFGIVASIREHGKLTFLILEDKNGIVQVTVHKNNVSEAVYAKVKTLQEQSFIGVKGKVKSTEKAPHGAEIAPSDLRLLSIPQSIPPFKLYKQKLPNIEKRLDLRAVDLRRPQAKAIFKIKHMALQSIRGFFSERGYLEVETPKIISTATEGGAALFPLLYYNKEAFLAQSPQLYKEQLISAFEKVFEIGPIFRAERSRTMKHLSEATSVDLEEAYVTYEDVMKTLDEVITHTVSDIASNCKDELALLKVKLKVPQSPFKIYTYDEIIGLLKAEGVDVEWGNDLYVSEMKLLEKKLPDFYFIKDWPTASKAFYLKAKEDNPEICESFDLMHGSLEISSGGSRIDQKQALMDKLKERSFDPKAFEYHLKVFDYGMPPHAGFGFGLDRFMMVLCKQKNIREVVLYPRDQRRLIP
ncbi:MAG: aspartate--tRNA(Asn) ligase [Candidatus Bathyarchaeota archaeon]|nr:aspartate--tRNA(Asn) ligase [Candidatus Bathyarchaeota archaeon]